MSVTLRTGRTRADDTNTATNRAGRLRQYRVNEDAIRASVPAISESAYVTLGVRVKDDAGMLLVVDGNKVVGLPLCAIGAAVSGNVIRVPASDAQ